MKSCREIKRAAKAVLKANYWVTVFVIVVLMSLGAVSLSSYSMIDGSSLTDSVEEKIDESRIFDSMDQETRKALVIVLAVFLIILFTVLFFLNIYIELPLIVGADRFALNAARGKAQPGDTLTPFTKGQYMNIVGSMFLKNLKIFLWSLLFIIPAIIKYYQFRLVSHILADNPNVTPAEALILSRTMMAGKKWKCFVLDLSFIWWDLLSVLTCGILAFFYVIPLKLHASAGFYEEIKKDSPKACEVLASR